MELPVGSFHDLQDVPAERDVTDSEVVFSGKIFDVRRDTVELGDGPAKREYVEHPGAVVVAALTQVDGVDHVLMIRQYRHPVRAQEWELPAGILDEKGEDPLAAARRELAEEVDLVAERWDVLVDFFSSPGMASEALRVYLARDISDASDAYQRGEEEADITGRWVPLDDAYQAVLTGRIHNPGAVIGILTTWGARRSEWVTLRPADSPWPWYA